MYKNFVYEIQFIFIDLKYEFGWIENFQSILIHFRLLDIYLIKTVARKFLILMQHVKHTSINNFTNTVRYYYVKHNEQNNWRITCNYPTNCKSIWSNTGLFSIPKQSLAFREQVLCITDINSCVFFNWYKSPKYLHKMQNARRKSQNQKLTSNVL